MKLLKSQVVTAFTCALLGTCVSFMAAEPALALNTVLKKIYHSYKPNSTTYGGYYGFDNQILTNEDYNSPSRTARRYMFVRGSNNGTQPYSKGYVEVGVVAGGFLGNYYDAIDGEQVYYEAFMPNGLYYQGVAGREVSTYSGYWVSYEQAIAGNYNWIIYSSAISGAIGGVYSSVNNSMIGPINEIGSGYDTSDLRDWVFDVTDGASKPKSRHRNGMFLANNQWNWALTSNNSVTYLGNNSASEYDTYNYFFIDWFYNPDTNGWVGRY